MALPWASILCPVGAMKTFRFPRPNGAKHGSPWQRHGRRGCARFAIFILSFVVSVCSASDGIALLKSLSGKYSSAKNITVKFSEAAGKIHGTATVAGPTHFRIELNDRI